MKAVRVRSDEERAAERARAARPLDSGEARAIMIGAVVLTIFLYFIKLILLPFVLAGIVAYIFTPGLDWAAKRTGWPRVPLAVALFLVLFGIIISVFTLAGQRLLDRDHAAHRAVSGARHSPDLPPRFSSSLTSSIVMPRSIALAMS